jgi:hypothetical protein
MEDILQYRLLVVGEQSAKHVLAVLSHNVWEDLLSEITHDLFSNLYRQVSVTDAHVPVRTVSNAPHDLHCLHHHPGHILGKGEVDGTDVSACQDQISSNENLMVELT